MSPLRLIPRGPEAFPSLVRASALLVIAGMILLSAGLFTDAPLPLVILVSLGTLGMVCGFLTWAVAVRALRLK